MQFKDYYDVMGVDKSATPDDIKRAHRKLARKYHPDVSREKDAEAQFKAVAEAYDVLKDPEKRAAYDDAALNQHAGQEFQPPPGWAQQRGRPGADSGFDDFSGSFSQGEHSEFFDTLFRGMGDRGGGARQRATMDRHGQDQHAGIEITLEDSYLGASRTIELRIPTADGQRPSATRTLEFSIPKGIRGGQHIRLAGQGMPGTGQGHAGDLYLDVAIAPHALYTMDPASPTDVLMDLPVTPWEAALGAEVQAPTPTGRVEVKIPAGSSSGRKLRLKGRGLPATGAGKLAGDFYFTLRIVQPQASSEPEKSAYEVLASAFAGFNPRAPLAHENGFEAPPPAGSATSTPPFTAKGTA
jgi:curved DNA-binding protein